MNHLSLFSGIGGMDLGLERAGMVTVGQVEIDATCRAVLSRHWPDVPKHDDVRTAVAWWRSLPRPKVHVVSGGFPCQPFSTAGRQKGTADERNMWPHMAEVIQELRPQYVIGENVPGLLSWDGGSYFGRVLGDLADLGYVVEWSVVSACAVGAPHVRRRLLIVGYSRGLVGSARMARTDGRTGQAEVRANRHGEHAWSSPGIWLAPARGPSGMAGGLTARMVAAGGNAVVPQVAEVVGRRVMAMEAS